MNKKLTEKNSLLYLLAVILLFEVLLFVSSCFSGVAGKILYYLSFILPIALFFIITRTCRVSLHGVPVKLKRENIKLFIPTVAPTVATVFLISFLTSIVLSKFGIEDTLTDVSGNIFLVIILHALLPAVFEEMLFRYIPMALLADFSKWRVVLVSSLLFAIAHASPYQIPYAFIAGAVFIILDIMFDSIMPSLIIHFLNNFVSVFWLRNSESTVFSTVYVVTLVVFTVVSVTVMVMKKHSYKEKFCLHFDKQR